MSDPITPDNFTRAQRRQLARAQGWRGVKSSRSRTYFRPDLAIGALTRLRVLEDARVEAEEADAPVS